MNAQFQKKLMLGTTALALVFGSSPQTVFADAPVMVQATTAQSATVSKLNSTVVTGTVIKASLTTPAKSMDQVTFKEFIKDMNPKSNVPSKILIQAEKAFKQYQSELKAKQNQKAMETFEKLMQLLEPYQDFKVITVKAINTNGK